MITRLLLALFFTGLISCTSFRYGYTHDQAQNAYYLVNATPNDFGSKRIAYNLGHHKNSQLACFLQQRGYPELIYEFEDQKRDGIKLYYVNVDSAYVFLESKKSNPATSNLAEARAMTEEERQKCALYMKLSRGR